MKTKKANQLWLKLRAAGLVSDIRLPSDRHESPWYVRFMLAFSGWVVALCIFGIAGIMIRLDNDGAVTFFIVGIVLCLLAILVDRVGEGDFAIQFSFALSISAQLMMIYSFYHLMGWDGRHLAAAILALEFSLFFAITGLLHSIWAALVAGLALLYLVIGLHHPQLSLSLILATFAVIWVTEYRSLAFRHYLRPLGYASLVALCLGLGFLAAEPWLGFGASQVPPSGILDSASALFTGLVVIATTYALLHEQAIDSRSFPGFLLMFAAAVVAVLGIWAPGIAVAYVMFMIGFAHSNVTLLGVGIILLLVYLGNFYYALDLPLLNKAALLLTSGLLLMAMRLPIRRFLSRRRPQFGRENGNA